MRKIFILLCLIAVQVNAQNWVTFENYDGGNSYSTPKSTEQQVRTTGYVYDSYTGDFKKVSIKIGVASSAYGEKITIKEYYNPQTGMWLNAYNSMVQELNRYSDGELANHFNYKASVANLGTVYIYY